MSIITNVLTKFFGNKYERDLKELSPYVEAINNEYKDLQSLSNDELRSKTKELKRTIYDFIVDENNEIKKFKEEAEQESDIIKKESLYDEIDKLEKQVDEKLEEVLNELLPQAFAVIKETARRFKGNETLNVTANDFDRNLATDFDFVEISGDEAIYHNHWLAGGNEITWDMVH